ALPVTSVVIPFAGVEGKTRLHLSRRTRRVLSLAMLGDVLAAAVAVGDVRVVTPDPDGVAAACEAGAEVVDDPGGGQGPAVLAGLAGLEPGTILILNADVPCVVPDDLRLLLAATPAGGIALVEALDGTTNALSVPAREAFADLYVLGLHVSPDLDSILYALAGLNDEQRGWGRADETWAALATVATLGWESWFRLGDRDLGLHLVRTQALRAGEPLSAVTARIARALGVETQLF